MKLGQALFVSSQALTLWAFLTLAMTGSVHTPMIALFLVLFVLGLMRRRLGIGNSPRLWWVISIAALLGAIAGWVYYNERLYSVVYLFLYLVVNRLWTMETNRDALQLYALSFFMVLAASVSTTSVVFGPMAVIYVALVMATLVMFTIKRDAELALGMPDGRRRREKKPPAPSAPRRLVDTDRNRLEALRGRAVPLGPSGLALTLATTFVVVFGAGLFFLIPRMEVTRFFEGLTPLRRDEPRMGFSDTIDLTSTGEIQRDPTIVGRVQAFDESGNSRTSPPRSILRLRGRTLEKWQGRTWTRDLRLANESKAQESQESIWLGKATEAHAHLRETFRVMLEPQGTSALFLPDHPINVLFDRPFNGDSDAGSRLVSYRAAPSTLVAYRVVSAPPLSPVVLLQQQIARERTPPPSNYFSAAREFLQQGLPRFPGRRSSDGGNEVNLTPDRQRPLLDLPLSEDAKTVRTLAEEWVGDRTRPLEVAIEIERRLKEDFLYTLDTSDFSQGNDHLTRFLRVERRGHCEYFATAMTLMLRARNIPARVVTGFATDEWSGAGGGFYVIRQAHAHSWVEAHIAGLGWVTFDPTPSDGIGTARDGNTLYRAFTRYADAIKLVWYDFVVDYNFNDQKRMFSALLDPFTGNRGFSVLDRLDLTLNKLIQSSSETRPAVVRTLLGGIAIMTLVVVWVLWKHLANRRRHKKEVAATRAARRAAIPAYLRLLAILERHQPRSRAQTPLEYVRRVAERTPGLDGLEPLTSRYYACRYNGTSWSQEEEAEAGELARAAEEIFAPASRGQRPVAKSPSGSPKP